MKIYYLLPLLLIFTGCYTVHYPVSYCKDDIYVAAQVPEEQNELQVSQSFYAEGNISSEELSPFLLLLGILPNEINLEGLGQIATGFSMYYNSEKGYSVQIDLLSGIFTGFIGVDAGSEDGKSKNLYSYGIFQQTGYSVHMIKPRHIVSFGIQYALSLEIGGTYKNYRDNLTSLEYLEYSEDMDFDAAPSGLSSTCLYYFELLARGYEKEISPFFRPFISCSSYDSLIPFSVEDEDDYSRIIYMNGIGLYTGLRRENKVFYCRYEIDPNGSDFSVGVQF